jgi:hypothetical protein
MRCSARSFGSASSRRRARVLLRRAAARPGAGDGPHGDRAVLDAHEHLGREPTSARPSSSRKNRYGDGFSARSARYRSNGSRRSGTQPLAEHDLEGVAGADVLADALDPGLVLGARGICCRRPTSARAAGSASGGGRRGLREAATSASSARRRRVVARAQLRLGARRAARRPWRSRARGRRGCRWRARVREDEQRRRAGRGRRAARRAAARCSGRRRSRGSRRRRPRSGAARAPHGSARRGARVQVASGSSHVRGHPSRSGVHQSDDAAGWSRHARAARAEERVARPLLAADQRLEQEAERRLGAAWRTR